MLAGDDRKRRDNAVIRPVNEIADAASCYPRRSAALRVAIHGLEQAEMKWSSVFFLPQSARWQFLIVMALTWQQRQSNVRRTQSHGQQIAGKGSIKGGGDSRRHTHASDGSGSSRGVFMEQSWHRRGIRAVTTQSCVARVRRARDAAIGLPSRHRVRRGAQCRPASTNGLACHRVGSLQCDAAVRRSTCRGRSVVQSNQRGPGLNGVVAIGAE